MKAQLKENTLQPETNESLTSIKKPRQARPNIDHLIKKILTERRKQEKKNIILIISVG